MQHVLVALIALVLISLLYTLAITYGASARWPAGVLAYGPAFRYLVLFFWACVIGFVVFGFIEGPDSRGELITGICALLVFSSLNLILHLEFFRVRIAFSEDGITTMSPWRPSRRIQWPDVLGIRYSQWAAWYVMTTKDQGDVRCHLYLSGLGAFLAELRNRGYDVPEAPAHL